MLRRKAIFLFLSAEQLSGAVGAEVLDLVRDFGGMEYVPVPVIASATDEHVGEIVRLRTGAPVSRPLLLDGGFAPQRVWEFARALDLDLERSVLVAPHTWLDAVFLTAGLRRILRPRRAQQAA